MCYDMFVHSRISWSYLICTQVVIADNHHCYLGSLCTLDIAMRLLSNGNPIFQHRAAQENIMYKDEQLREAQAWVQRVQLQSTTNQSLQAELRERTEQFNQLWMGCQRQVSLNIFYFYRVVGLSLISLLFHATF